MSQDPIITPSPSAEIPLSGHKVWLDEIKKQLEDGTITDERWAQLQTFFKQNQFSPIQPSMICKDTECKFYSACPLVRANIPRPTGLPCVVEETCRELWFKQLSREIGVAEDGFEALDLGAACDLINIMLQKQRIQWELVKNPEVATRTIVGMTNKGEPIIDLKANPAFFALKAMNQIQLKITESLMATREARSKDESRKTTDAAKLYAQFENLYQRVKTLSSRSKDGSPTPVLELLNQLPEMQSADEKANQKQKEEE